MRVLAGQSSKHVEFFSKVMVGSGGFIGIWNYAKNTMFLNVYKSFVELKGENGGVEPSVKLSSLVNEVIQDLQDRASEYTDIQPIIVPGVNIFNMGTVGTFSGGFIGLPAYFESNTVDDISEKFQMKKKMFLQNNEATETNTEDAYNLLLLSEEAKKYAIAREVLLINNLQVYVDTILPFVSAFVVAAMLNHPSMLSGLAAMPLNSRFLFFTVVTLITIVLWRKTHSFVKRYYENQAVEDIGTLGEKYIRGALEYNSKEMQRNAYVIEMKNESDRILLSVKEKFRHYFVPRGLSSVQKYHHFKQLFDSNAASINS